MSLERIVRPGQSKSVGLAAPYYGPATPAVDEPPNLEWGGGGASVFDVKISAYNEVVEFKEQSRTFDIMRVKNSQDETQFVDVETAKSITVRKSNGEVQTTNYTPSPENNFVEAVKRDLTRAGS